MLENKQSRMQQYFHCLDNHVFRGLDLSNMTHHRPLVRGDDKALISSAQWRKMAIIIYILACFNKWMVHRLHAS